LDLCSERRFHLLLNFFFFHFVGNNSYDEATCSSKRLYKLKPMLDHIMPNLGVYMPQSVKCQLMSLWWCWRDISPSKSAIFCIKSFELLNQIWLYIEFYYLHSAGYHFWWVPKKWAIWLKSSSTGNDSCTESGMPCNRGQLVFKPKSVP
jgi:hypothetical protein